MQVAARADGAVVAVEVGVVADDLGIDRVGNRESNGRAGGHGLAAVHLVAASGIQVLGEAAVAAVAHRQTEAGVVADRASVGRLAVVTVEVAQLEVHIAFGLVAGRAVDDVDHAGGGVTAVERALRSAQHLDALHVEELGQAHLGAALIDAVLVHGHRRILADAEQVGAHAADIELRFAAGAAEYQRRHVEAQVLDFVQAAILKQVAADGGDGQGRVLDRRLAFLRGNDDLFEDVLLGRHVCRNHHAAAGKCGQR